MGKKNRQQRRAARKKRRADRKRNRADRAAANGNTSRADKLNRRADRLDARAAELNTRSEQQQGCSARLYDLNSLGSCHIRIEWNYANGARDSRFHHHEVSIASSSPFRRLGREVKDVDGAVHHYDSGPLGDSYRIPNARYVVKVFGASDAAGSNLVKICRCIAKRA